MFRFAVSALDHINLRYIVFYSLLNLEARIMDSYWSPGSYYSRYISYLQYLPTYLYFTYICRWKIKAIHHHFELCESLLEFWMELHIVPIPLRSKMSIFRSLDYFPTMLDHCGMADRDVLDLNVYISSRCFPWEAALMTYEQLTPKNTVVS